MTANAPEPQTTARYFRVGLACDVMASLAAIGVYFGAGSARNEGGLGILLWSAWLLPLIVGFVLLTEALSQNAWQRVTFWGKWMFGIVIAAYYVNQLIKRTPNITAADPSYQDGAIRPLARVYDLLVENHLLNEALLFCALVLPVTLSLWATFLLVRA